MDYTLSKTGVRSTYRYDPSTRLLLAVDSDDFRADYYPDGSLKEFWSKPDQKRSFYEGGLLTRILTSEGAEYFYEAVKTPQGDTQVTLSSFKTPGGLLYTLGPRTISHVSPEAVTEYDLNGTLLGTRSTGRGTFTDFYTTGEFKGLVSRVGYPGGFEEITYSKDSNGEIRHQRYRRVLKRKRFLSGSRAYWIRKLVGEGKGAWSIPTPPAPDLSTLPDLRRIVYSPDRSPREVWKADGSKLTFEEGSSSDFPGLGGVSVFQNNLDARYDATGRLTQVQVGDLTFHYRKDAPGIDFILKEDGTRLSDLTFENGTLTGARIQS
ncbi:MAG: hypothetical protein HYT89_04375, partial [Candidatus Omnitrophica bacterium]|nr:hypothetical protein [Candidatus Omnitrophota bacterium]